MTQELGYIYFRCYELENSYWINPKMKGQTYTLEYLLVKINLN